MMVGNTASVFPDELESALSDDSRKVVQYAKHEADRMNNAVCTTAHLLLGLIRIGKGTAFERYQTRYRWGGSNTEARRLVQDTFANVSPALTNTELWTKTSLEVLFRARGFDERGRITPDHLFEALLQMDESYASVILDRLDEERF
jgi:ATP-dependent Clp protease ATP-binding subunit ClpA